jgi:hypothetical protein
MSTQSPQSQNLAPITAYFTPGIPGYGHRLFIPAPPLDAALSSARYEQISEANTVLKDLSCWKGSDKRWGIDGVEYWGYEFSKGWWDDDDPSRSIKAQVEAAGMIIKDFAEERQERQKAGRVEMKVESLF